jgi:hypothetical protein
LPPDRLGHRLASADISREVEMTKRSRWAPGLVLIALLVTWAVVGTAAASTPTVKSTVTITSGEGTGFTGKVKAAQRKCRAGRKVKLFMESNSGGGDELVGTARTDATGAWMMDGSFFAGVYYARVLAALIQIHGMSYRCGADFSIRQHF